MQFDMHGLSPTVANPSAFEGRNMKSHDDVLQQIVRIARSSRGFFVEMYPRVTDSDVRTAFGYIVDVKSQLLVELAPWAPQAAHDQAGSDHSDSALADRTSPAAVVEKMYADARKNFRGEAPATCANALSFGEEQLLKLTERAFEESHVPALKELLKSYYGQLVICREAMLRLHARLAA
jgi:hypothetical protein